MGTIKLFAKKSFALKSRSLNSLNIYGKVVHPNNLQVSCKNEDVDCDELMIQVYGLDLSSKKSYLPFQHFPMLKWYQCNSATNYLDCYLAILC